ncbi:MAG: hypothetical protein JSV88_32515 [Candidatus Aminicenantes bacterium]|nr:MAG: hypothetical protein JSV88_32515 [Candidatus Aminicenantes bacterium]
MRSLVEGYHVLSMWIPTSYYRTVSEEVSSRGFLNYLDFSDYTRKKKDEFFKFYMIKLYFTSNFSKIENFVKGTENIYQAKPRVPGTFWYGQGLMVFYILFFLFLSYLRFKKCLYSLRSSEASRVNPNKLKISKGNLTVYSTPDSLMPNLLYILFSGKGGQLFKKGFGFKLEIDGKALAVRINDLDFLYVCDTASLPGEMRSVDLIYLLCSLLKVPIPKIAPPVFSYIDAGVLKRKIRDLADYQQGELLLLPLLFSQRSIYLVKDTAKGMPLEYIIRLKDRMEELAGSGASVLYLTTEDGLPNPRSIKDKPVLLIQSREWIDKIDYLKKQMSAGLSGKGNNIKS